MLSEHERYCGLAWTMGTILVLMGRILDLIGTILGLMGR